MKRFNPIAFYRELRHRRVFRVAVLYGVAAWVVVGACDILFPQFPDWVADPDAALRAVIIVAVLLAPVALVLGWLYDVTPDGVRRTASFPSKTHDPDTSLHRVDRWVLGALGVVIAAVLAVTSWYIVRMEPPAAGETASTAVPENSIAVLPFEVCAGTEVDPLLATGVASEVLRHLAEIPNLKVTAKSLIVIARASAFAFAGADVQPRRIASTLRVHYLLTARLCRQGDALTVHAELVDERGYLAWSHDYTEQLDAAGQVTRTVARQLAQGVAGRLGTVMPVPGDEAVDRIAYEQLLIGREFLEQGDEEKARAAFEAALDRKPDYAEAVYELAMTEAPSIWWGADMRAKNDKTRLLMKRALAMARRDVERNPSSAHAHYVIGDITLTLTRIEQRTAWHESAPEDTAGWSAKFAEAERHLQRSVELNPSNSEAWFDLSLALEEIGRDSEALAVLRQGVERDPLNSSINGLLAIKLAELGRYEEAIALLDRFRQLPAVPVAIWTQRFRVDQMRGRWDLFVQDHVEMLEHPGYPNPARRDGTVIWVVALVPNLRDFGLKAEAEAVMARLDGIRRPAGNDWFLPLEEQEKIWYQRASRMTDKEILDLGLVDVEAMARALANRGEHERAVRLLEVSSRERLFTSVRTWTPFRKIPLAVLYLKTGRDAEAAKVLADLSQFLEAKVSEGYRNGITLGQLALTQAMQGKVDAAIATLELSQASGNSFIDGDVCFDPGFNFFKVLDPWATLRSDPRFQKLYERCEVERKRQLESIRALLASRDLDKLLAPIMALAAEEKAQKRAAEGGK